MLLGGDHVFVSGLSLNLHRVKEFLFASVTNVTG